MIKILLFSFSILFSLVGYAHDINSELEYIANEGVLFTHGEKSVIFDSFYSDSINGTYLLVDQDTQKALLAAKPPYQHIKLAFVSHIHGDHFSATPTLKYLRERKNVRLIAPGQVVDALLNAGGEDVKSQLIRVDLAPGEAPIDIPVEHFKVKAAAVPHIHPMHKDVENLIFSVSIKGSPTIAHLGDATQEKKWYPPLEDFFKPVNIALVPSWFITMDEAKDIVTEFLKDAYIIGIHLPAESKGMGKKYRDYYKKDMFTDPGERRTYDSVSGNVVFSE